MVSTHPRDRSVPSASRSPSDAIAAFACRTTHPSEHRTRRARSPQSCGHPRPHGRSLPPTLSPRPPRPRTRGGRRDGVFHLSEAPPRTFPIRRCDGARRAADPEERFASLEISRRARPLPWAPPGGHARCSASRSSHGRFTWLRLVAPRARLSADSRRGRDRAPQGAARASSPPAVRARVDFFDATYPRPDHLPARPLVSPSLKPRLPIPPPFQTRRAALKNSTTTEEVVWGETASATASPAPTREKGFVTGRPEEQFSAEAAEERQELFNEIAPVYDQLNDLLSFGLHRVWKRAAVKWTGVREGDRAIDVCCGSGDIAIRLADAVGPTGEVVGLDFAAAQLRVAAEKEANSRRGSLPSWRRATRSLPFRTGVRRRPHHRIRPSQRPGHPARLASPQTRGRAAVVDFNNATDPNLNALQGFILDNVVVPVADLNGVAAEYRYCDPPSSDPKGPELGLGHEAGFAKATFYELAPGNLMGCLVCEKCRDRGWCAVEEMRSRFAGDRLHVVRQRDETLRSLYPTQRRAGQEPGRTQRWIPPDRGDARAERGRATGRLSGSARRRDGVHDGGADASRRALALRDGILASADSTCLWCLFSTPRCAQRRAPRRGQPRGVLRPRRGSRVDGDRGAHQGRTRRRRRLPRNETAACALVLELLSEAGAAAAAVLPAARAPARRARAPRHPPRAPLRRAPRRCRRRRHGRPSRGAGAAAALAATDRRHPDRPRALPRHGRRRRRRRHPRRRRRPPRPPAR